LFTLIHHQYPAVAHFLTHSVNFAFGPISDFKKNCRARTGSSFRIRPVYISAVNFTAAALSDGSNWWTYLHFNCLKITSIRGYSRAAVKCQALTGLQFQKGWGPLALGISFKQLL